MIKRHQNSLISDHEYAEVRHALGVMRSQVRAPRIDVGYFERQIDKLESLVSRMEAEHHKLTQQGRFEALYTVSRLLGSSLDIQTVLDQVMDAIIQLTTAERGFLMLRDDDGQIAVVAARNFDQQTLIGDQSLFSRTIVNQVMDSGEPILTTNASEDPRFNMQESVMGRSLKSIMATPLRARGMVIGAAYVENQAVAGLFQPDDLTALETFAGQAAVAIDNAQLFSATDQQLAARVYELSQLRRIDMQLNETLDADKAMSITLDWLCRVCDANIGHLGLVNDDHVVANHHFAFPVEEGQQVYLDELYPAVNDAVRERETLLLGDGDPENAHILIVPARREKNVIAVAVLVKTHGIFSPEQRDLVERIVARAGVAIENGTLYAAVKAADLAKSEFVGIVAHDLKVPMTSIIGYADLTLMDGGLTEEQQYFQTRIRETVERMEMLVSDLADISRIESGHFFMTPSRIRVSQIMQGVRDSIMTQIETRQHHYVEAVEPELPALHADYYRLLQVLTNLTSNAYKYTPNGGTITVAARNLGERIEFSVTDTGIGLSAEQIKNLGKKFWRAGDDFTRSQPGTGLGFAITRNLVEQMGSTITVESEPGKGSRFTFSVPVSME
ncbi:MAG: GAF domain-containing protein [bacterium]|nr:GAF domain-containing protein [bacterium]